MEEVGKNFMVERGSSTCVFCCQHFVFSFSNYNQRGRKFLPAFRKYLYKFLSKSAIETTLNVEFHAGIYVLIQLLMNWYY